jgi:hypothetical protein
LDRDGNCQGGTDVPGGTTLLSGTFTGPTAVAKSGTTFKIAGGSFPDQKTASLLAFFGLPADDALKGNFNISFQTPASPPRTFVSTTVLSGNVSNATVPDP